MYILYFSDLAPSLPLEVDPHTFDSPHTKAHLLFQAHFTRLPLPSTDYLTDTNSVLDQAIRTDHTKWLYGIMGICMNAFRLPKVTRKI